MTKIDFKPVPFMAYEEMLILDDLLREKKPENCLEYGGGGSSIYFPQNHPYIKQWDTIESASGWYLTLLEQELPKSVNVHFVSDLPTLERYITYPSELGGKYDFILVDGIDETRVHCMEYASKHLLNPKGILVLHDSGRLRYRDAYKYFKHHKELAPGIGTHPDGGAGFRGLTMFWND